MNHFPQDIRFALRLLRRSPGFTAVVVLSLALGIGASTAMFTVVHAALLKPLPFKDSDRLVTAMNGPSAAEGNPLNYPQLLQWRDEFKVFEDVAGYFNWGATIGGAGDPERVPAMRGTASLFSILGVQPIVGPALHEGRRAAGSRARRAARANRSGDGSTTPIRTFRAGASSSTTCRSR